MRIPSPSCMAARFLATALLASSAIAADSDYRQVDALFAKHCLDCHSTQDPEGNLVMDSHAALMKGGENGPALIPGQSAESLLIKAVEGRWEKDGKVRVMPPGKRKKLQSEEIGLLRSWIDAGAPAPRGGLVRELVTPHVRPRSAPARSIQSLAVDVGMRWLAVGRYAEVEIRSAENRAVLKTLGGHRGNVNAVAFSRDGRFLVSAAGQPGLAGELKIWSMPDAQLKHTIIGHRDALYSVDVSPDGRTVATGSYDQEVRLWELETGRELLTLHGHNGAVYDVAFRPDGRILATASGDRTVKLWEIPGGRRLDTLTQPTREVHSLAWSGSGGRLFAAGVDNRIRAWSVSAQGLETTNPLLESRFAHEGAIINLTLSPDGKLLASAADDRTVKIWDTANLTETLSLPAQPDLAPGLAFVAAGKELAVGRLDGTVEQYDTGSGKAVAPSKPELLTVTPRGLQRGSNIVVRLKGRFLAGASQVKFSVPQIEARAFEIKSADEIEAQVAVSGSAARGMVDLTVETPAGLSPAIKVWVDDLPQLEEDPAAEKLMLALVPATVWGALEKPGDNDEFEFAAGQGEEWVFDLGAVDLGSKLNARLELYDSTGVLVAHQSAFDGGDPLLVHRVRTPGRHRLVVKDDAMAGSAGHAYRVSLGVLPFVAGVFPTAISAGNTGLVSLVGYNLGPDATAGVDARAAGSVPVSLDAGRHRWRRVPTVEVHPLPVVVESEPNDEPSQARMIPVPGVAVGRIWDGRPAAAVGRGDTDIFSFQARAGQPLILETEASRKGSPVDTRLEVLTSDGRPVPRILLQAVRNTAVNFRSADANASGMRLDHYEEMELNQYLYLSGDIMKLFRMPQGPDSEMVMYTRAGKRRAFFDTTATAHSLDEQGFIVSPHPLGTRLASNGLPVFTLYHSNDDDGDRVGGADSKLQFTAPTDGEYRVRVTDALQREGARYFYHLRIREPNPGFTVSLEGANPTIAPGSGQAFTVRADRRDGFSGAIRVSMGGLPAGFTGSTALLIEAGHDSVSGVIHAAADARPPGEADGNGIQVTAQAEVEGRFVSMTAGSMGRLRLADKPSRILVGLEAYVGQDLPSATNGPPPLEITMAPGQTVPAWLFVKRNGQQDVTTFEVNNLPHGVIVDNLGLNGITFLKDESQRQIFLTASKWVQPMDRLFYAVEGQSGRQTSRPVMLKIRPSAPQTAALDGKPGT